MTRLSFWLITGWVLALFHRVSETVMHTLDHDPCLAGRRPEPTL